MRETNAIPAHGLGIRLESIGGLGANLAGKILAEACVLYAGFNASQFSSYGSEKKGSPVTTYIRVVPSENTIRITEPILTPDVIAVFHEALLRDGNCLAGVSQGGIVLVNTRRLTEDIQQQTKLSGLTIVCIDAQKIAIEEHTRVNSVMLGALCAVVDCLEPEAVKQSLSDALGRKYRDLVEANLRTFDRGFSEVVTRTFAPEQPLQQDGLRRVQHSPLMTLAGGVIDQPGNSVRKNLSGSRQGFVPALKLESCIHCAACDQVCPDFCFVWEARTDERGRTFQFLQGIDYQYCKGCQKCVEACPTDALSTVLETAEYVEEHRALHHW